MSNPPKEEPEMFQQVYESIVGAFPSRILFPRVNERHRTTNPLFTEVRSVEDLPNRLILGDLVSGSFAGGLGAWSVRYRDASGNGLDLSVRGECLEITSRFLGREIHGTGDASSRLALDSLRVDTPKWDGVLKEHLEARYPIHVFVRDDAEQCTLFLPDGWMKVLLVPVAPAQLQSLFDWYMALARDPALGTSQNGAVSLLFNAVNYVEGRCPPEICSSEQLLFRGLRLCGAPPLAEAVREEGSDGTAAWTVRRNAYLFHCGVFMRDVPHVVETLAKAGLLSEAPDLCTAVLPEGVVEAKQIHWWSPDRECRITWAFEPPFLDQFVSENRAELETTARLIQQAMDAGVALQKHLGVV